MDIVATNLPKPRLLRFTHALSIVCSLMLAGTGCAWKTQSEPKPISSKPAKITEASGELRYKPNPLDRRIERTLYLGFGLGVSKLEPDTSEVPGWDVDDPTNAGNQFTLGADLSRQLSVELHRSGLGSAGLSPQGRISYDVTALSALFYVGKNRHMYRRRGLTGYGRIGLGYLDNRAVGTVQYQQDNAAHLLYGVGLEYMFRIGLGIRGDLISFDKDVRYGQLGLIYRLGRKDRRRSEYVAVKDPAPTPVFAKSPESTPVIAPVAAIAVDHCTKLEGVLDVVSFHSDSAQLTEAAEPKLDDVARVLKQCQPTEVLISGHTDSIGSASYNDQLSNRRVDSVMDYLKSSGVDSPRLRGKAFGEKQPIAGNDTPAGRKLNRRVELTLSR